MLWGERRENGIIVAATEPTGPHPRAAGARRLASQDQALCPGMVRHLAREHARPAFLSGEQPNIGASSPACEYWLRVQKKTASGENVRSQRQKWRRLLVASQKVLGGGRPVSQISTSSPTSTTRAERPTVSPGHAVGRIRPRLSPPMGLSGARSG